MVRPRKSNKEEIDDDDDDDAIIFIELMTLDRKRKASREGSK